MRMMKIEDSSNVAAIGYDLATATLRVRFRGGGLYDYPEITPVQLADMVSSDSLGKWVHAELVKTKHECRPLAESREIEPPKTDRRQIALELIASSPDDSPLRQIAREALDSSGAGVKP